MLSVLYDTGARVQELIDLNAGDVRLDPPSQVRLLGKGRKLRAVPLMDTTVELLLQYRRDNNLDRPEHADKPLFQNRQGARLSRSGVRYLLQKYVVPVRRNHPDFTQRVSPHSLRHYLTFLIMSGDTVELPRPSEDYWLRRRRAQPITRHNFLSSTKPKSWFACW